MVRRVRLRAEDGARRQREIPQPGARPPARGRRPGRRASAAGVPVERRPGDGPALPARRRCTGSSSAAARRRRRRCCRPSFATASRPGRPRSEGIVPNTPDFRLRRRYFPVDARRLKVEDPPEDNAFSFRGARGPRSGCGGGRKTGANLGGRPRARRPPPGNSDGGNALDLSESSNDSRPAVC